MIFYGGRSNHAEAGRIKWVAFIYQQQNSVNTLALLLMMYRMGFDQISAIASRKAKVAISNERLHDLFRTVFFAIPQWYVVLCKVSWIWRQI